jgi:hypothetical protein
MYKIFNLNLDFLNYINLLKKSIYIIFYKKHKKYLTCANHVTELVHPITRYLSLSLSHTRVQTENCEKKYRMYTRRSLFVAAR